MKDNPSVFISYSHKNRRRKKSIKKQLQERYYVWSDESFEKTSEWWEKIIVEIGKCDIFLFLLSDHSVQSPFCRSEFAEAVRLQKPIIIVRISRMSRTPNYLMQPYLICDITNLKKENALQKITQTIDREISAHLSKQESLWSEITPYPGQPISRTVYAHLDPKDTESSLNTGFILLPKDKVTIEAQGYVTVDWGKSHIDPNGEYDFLTYQTLGHNNFPHDEAYRVTGSPHEKKYGNKGISGSLIGWIGKGNYAGGKAIFIGKNKCIEAKDAEEGFLYLAVNDTPKTYYDNCWLEESTGKSTPSEFNVTIKVEYARND